MKTFEIDLTLSPQRILASDTAPAKVCVRGELGERLERSLRHLMADRPFSKEYFYSQITGDATHWKNFPTYHGDTAGRYLWTQVLAESANEQPSSGLFDYVKGLLELQNEDGSFGCTRFEDEPLAMGKAYGNAWMLKGLSEYARIFEADTAKQSAKRLFAFIERTFPLWRDAALSENATGFYAVSPSCYFHSFDGLMSYYAMSQDDAALKLARQFLPHLIPLDEADHSHMYLTTRRGVLEFIRHSGETERLEGVEAELETFWKKHVLEMGGIPERLVDEGPAEEVMDEACSLCDWYLVCMQLWEQTQRLCWLERAILVLENAIYFNQLDTGGFGSRCIGLPRYVQFGKEAYWCCSYFGPVALAMAGAQMVRFTNNTLFVDHLLEGVYRFSNDEEVSVSLNREALTYDVDLSKAPSVERLCFAQPHWLKWKQGEVQEGYCSVERSSNLMALGFEWSLWHSAARQCPEKLDGIAEGTPVTLYLGPWMMCSRGNGGEQVKLKLAQSGWGEGYSRQTARGMPSCAESLSICVPAEIEYSKYDLFLLPSDKDGMLRLYPFKDKESPDMVRTTFYFGLDDLQA